MVEETEQVCEQFYAIMSVVYYIVGYSPSILIWRELSK